MPDPEVVRVMRQFKRDLLAGEQAQMEQMASRWLRVEARLSSQMDALALQMSQYARDGGTVTESMLYNEIRYRTLLSQLTQELNVYSDYANRTITDRQRQLAHLGINHAVESITVQGVTGGFNRLPVEAVEYMVGMGGNGSPLRGLLVGTWPDAADGLTQALIDGVALGNNPRVVAREMARGSTATLNRMMVIARTEQLRVYRQANVESYRRSGVVTSYKRLCAHDSRVCPACLMDEGTVYDLEDTMPEHPQGRCTLVPVVEGVPQPKWVQGAEWFEQQSPTRQQSILGKGRFEAWKDGKFDLGELVQVVRNPTWGPSLQTTTLTDLLTGGAGRAAVQDVVASVPMTFGKLPPVIGEAHPEVIRIFQEEFEALAQDYPFLRDYVNAFDFTDSYSVSGVIGGEWDADTRTIRLGSGLAKMTPDEIRNAMSSHELVSGGTLDGLVIHETGHAIDSYVKFGVGRMSEIQDDYFDALYALKERIPSPSKYGESRIGEFVAEQFTKERLGGGDELQAIFREFIPQVDERNLEPEKPKRKKK